MNNDVFLSYNRRDAEPVHFVAKELKARQVQVWLDKSRIGGGEPFQPAIEDALHHSASVAVFIGPGEIGPFQDFEIQAANALRAEKKCRVIPVLLSGAKLESVPALLRGITVVEIRDLHDREAMRLLVCAIRGLPPDGCPEEAIQEEAGAEDVWKPWPASDSRVARPVHLLADRWQSGNVTFLVGQRASARPSTCHLTESLLRSMNLVDAAPAQLLPSLDTAATYYEVTTSPQSLELACHDVIEAKADANPQSYQLLGEVLALLGRRPAGRRPRDPQLIVTTNLDVLLERALLRAGVSFTRLVQHRPPKSEASAWKIEANEYSVVKQDDGTLLFPGGERIAAGDTEALDSAIRDAGPRLFACDDRDGLVEPVSGGEKGRPVPLKELTSPILYKFHGSHDVQDSCTISTDHYLQFAAERKRISPAIRSIIGSTPVLILGYGPVDPSFRHVYQSLLPVQPAENRYMVWGAPGEAPLDPYDRVDKRIWETAGTELGARLGLTIVATTPQTFLSELALLARQRYGRA